jgi:hypothetical protein
MPDSLTVINLFPSYVNNKFWFSLGLEEFSTTLVLTNMVDEEPPEESLEEQLDKKNSIKTKKQNNFLIFLLFNCFAKITIYLKSISSSEKLSFFSYFQCVIYN